MYLSFEYDQESKQFCLNGYRGGWLKPGRGESAEKACNDFAKQNTDCEKAILEVAQFIRERPIGGDRGRTTQSNSIMISEDAANFFDSFNGRMQLVVSMKAVPN